MILQTKYTAAVYAPSAGGVETSFCLTDLSEQKLAQGDAGDGQIVHIDLLWQPKAGRTPIEDSAVDASIRYVIFSKGEVGIYGGAGFVIPHGRIGKRSISISVRDASLILLESTPGFVDLLGRAEVKGKFTAELDDQRLRRLRYATSQLVTTALGKTRYVREGESSRQWAAARNPGLESGSLD